MSLPFAVLLKLALMLPRDKVAGLARQLLSSLAVIVEGKTTNDILHQGEVLAFGEIDQFLAKIESGTN